MMCFLLFDKYYTMQNFVVSNSNTTDVEEHKQIKKDAS